jgi:subtilisin family serine protease
MTDQGNLQPRGPFSWLRDIFRLKWKRPPIISHQRDRAAQTQKTQVDLILAAFDEKVGVVWDRDGDCVEFLYHPQHVLVDRDGVDRVREFFEGRQEEETGYRGLGNAEIQPIREELFIYELPPRHRDGQVNVLETLFEIDGALGEGVATPDHILYVVSTPGKYCPATEPELPLNPQPLPPLNTNSDAGKGVRVSVVDTGWYPPAALDSDSKWLATGVDGEVEPIGQTLGPYAGHGTFVAGVLRCVAPGTSIFIEGIMKKAGAVWESDIARELNDAMRKEPQLISISAGTHSRNGLPLLSFVVLSLLYKLVDGEDAPLVVAAAGNDGKSDKFWPAAFDWVVGVGSVDAEGDPSGFSNYGPWVDVYAHGEKLVNAYPTGDFKYVEQTSPLYNQTVSFTTGLAQWSGTSFATPIVTGAIAAYMEENKVKARPARDALIAASNAKTVATFGTVKPVGPPFM